MMDSAEDIPQGVHPEKKPHVDGEAPPYSPTRSVAVTKVLEDDNLLIEILLRVGFPTTLIRAALVCKRWLGHISDGKFLNCFHKLHPPRLLGYYITDGSIFSQRLDAPRFVPMLPQPRELGDVMRRLTSYTFGTHRITHCWNSCVYTIHQDGKNLTREVHRPLCAEKALQIIPPLPRAQGRNKPTFSQIILKEEGINMSYLYVLGEATRKGKSTTSVFVLQDGVWRTHTSATCPHGLYFGPKALLVDNKIYIPSFSGDYIIILDLVSSSFSTIQLPQGVTYLYFKSMLSRADDTSSVYLIHVEEFELCIWLHKGGKWLLVETICLHEMLAPVGISDLALGNEGIASVQIRQVGDNGQFVILRMGQCIFYMDIKCRTLCKVYESKGNNQIFGSIHPFLMIWPPTFPALKDDPARNTM